MLSEGYSVGFNSMFNITEQPTIWYEYHIIFFDPQLNLRYYDDFPVILPRRCISLYLRNEGGNVYQLLIM